MRSKRGERIPRNVWILAASQALAMSSMPMLIIVGGLLGKALAPSDKLSTLPLALTIVGTACSAIPVALFLKRVGRKRGGLVGFCFGLLACLLGYFAAKEGSFSLLICTGFSMGIFVANVQQFRFAALESVDDPANYGPVLSVLMTGGLVAAYLGPEMALFGKDLVDSPYGYAGSFIMLAGILVLSAIVFSFFREEKVVENKQEAGARPLVEIVLSPPFIIAAAIAATSYAMMSLVMTATPITMVELCGYGVENTKSVIQAHIMAMYVPSLFSGWLMKRFGPVRLIIAGITCYGIVLLIGTGGQQLIHFWGALILLGIGWNFLFVSGTALLPMSYRPAEKFKAQAVNDAVVFSCQAIASLSAGWLLFSFGWSGLLMACLPVIALAVALVIWLFIRQRS